jgi:hypothetical protein
MGPIPGRSPRPSIFFQLFSGPGLAQAVLTWSRPWNGTGERNTSTASTIAVTRARVAWFGRNGSPWSMPAGAEAPSDASPVLRAWLEHEGPEPEAPAARSGLASPRERKKRLAEARKKRWANR